MSLFVTSLTRLEQSLELESTQITSENYEKLLCVPYVSVTKVY